MSRHQQKFIQVDDRSAAYLFGNAVCTAVCAAFKRISGRDLKITGDSHDLQEDIQRIGVLWHPLGFSAAVVAEAFISRYSGSFRNLRFKRSWLHAGAAADTVRHDLQKDQALGLERGITVGEVAFEVDDGVAYGRRLLRGAGVALDDQAAVVAWLLLGVGSVDPVAAVILSNGAPAILEQHREELQLKTAIRPALVEYLKSSGYMRFFYGI